MMKFKKSLLALAIVGAVALPSLASAATLQYPTGKQITFAKDLIVNDGTTIDTPNSLTLAAEAADAPRITTVAAGSTVTVKVTLTNGAKFDSTADATTLVENFLVGTQLGGTNAVIGAANLVGTPYYSATGQELNFSFKSPGAGTAVFAATDDAIVLNSMQVTNLTGGLFTGSSIGAQITVQNNLGQQILASGATIAQSVWGLAVTGTPALGNLNTTIDVAANPRLTMFSSTGAVGLADQSYFNAGAVTLDIAKAGLIGGGTGYINNYNAVAASPEYNIVGTANITVTVTGTDLSAFANHEIWLDAVGTCTHVAATSLDGVVGTGAANNTATFTTAANGGLWTNVTNPAPSASQAFVCVGADGATPMSAQSLAGSVAVDYQLSTQRVNPPAAPFDLLPLRLNGTTLVFQNVNPGGNPTAQSFLRLTNNNAQACPVVIDAKDDAGKHTNDVTLTLAAHASQQLNSAVLEGLSTATGVTGSFGHGTGKWYVRVTAQCSNFKASALNRNSQTGTVTDLTPEKYVGNEWLTPTTHL